MTTSRHVEQPPAAEVCLRPRRGHADLLKDASRSLIGWVDNRYHTLGPSGLRPSKAGGRHFSCVARKSSTVPGAGYRADIAGPHLAAAVRAGLDRVHGVAAGLVDEHDRRA